MENKENKKELIIFADNDLIYGIEHGYYPSLSKAQSLGNLDIIPLGKDFSKFNLTKRPIGNGKDFYILDPYADSYISIWDEEILNTLVSDKSFAIKEALVRMGAKHIIVKESTKDIDNTKVVAKLTLSKTNVSSNWERHLTVDIKSSIESNDENRQAKDASSVEAFMIEHGLFGDAQLKMLLNRLKEDGTLHGTEKYEVTYLNELKSAFSIAANIDYKIFNAKLDLSTEHNHVHTISKSLEIVFD